MNSNSALARIGTLFAAILGLGSCAAMPLELKTGDLIVRLEPGAEWLHRYSALQKNPPQFAIWAEREDGSFGGTLFATRKVAMKSWAFNAGNPRKEALPVWMSRKAGEKVDAVAGATPRGASKVALSSVAGAAERRFLLYFEVNHSTDFNPTWPAEAAVGTPGYSGGAAGSGQPSVVYRCLVDLDAAPGAFEFAAIGHGSPDGSDGLIEADLSALTSALDIVARIVAEPRP